MNQNENVKRQDQNVEAVRDAALAVKPGVEKRLLELESANQGTERGVAQNETLLAVLRAAVEEAGNDWDGCSGMVEDLERREVETKRRIWSNEGQYGEEPDGDLEDELEDIQRDKDEWESRADHAYLVYSLVLRALDACEEGEE